MENFLQNIVRRKGNFHVIFLDTNKRLCIPPQAAQHNRHKYLLARAVILRHLRANLPAASGPTQVLSFESIGSPDFRQYLKRNNPYFVICHDGAFDKLTASSTVESYTPSKESMDQRVRLRFAIQLFMGLGYNVGLINSVEWKDTKENLSRSVQKSYSD